MHHFADIKKFATVNIGIHKEHGSFSFEWVHGGDAGVEIVRLIDEILEPFPQNIYLVLGMHD